MDDSGEGGYSNSARHDPLVGRRLASYEVMARVARGGMGVVYRARHVYIDKIVALKVLDPALAQREDLIERFRTEAQSLARVEHDNVVKVIDILEDKGVHFIVMDFAEGVNLRNHVKNFGPLQGDEFLSVARQTAEALYAAHRQGILHRDIKPENLIMNSRGRCKLADFGLAGDMRLIKEGHEGPLNFGTPAYSAPEVLRRMVPDKRSDIFAFGATMYFLATSEPPFGQAGAQPIMMRQKQGAELLDARRADLPEKLTALVMDCIRYHPKDRPASFNEVMDRLPRRIPARRIDPNATGPTEPTEPMQLDSGAHETPEISVARNVAVAVGAIVLAVVALAIVLGVALWPEGSPGPENESAQTPDPPDDADSDRQSPDNAPGDPEPVQTFKPEDEAFNDAELNSRASLSNADYSGAYSAWEDFIRDYPKSDSVADARERQRSVVLRVKELREQAYKSAIESSEEALKGDRTAEALAALQRFPAELLKPLSETDDVEVSQKLDTQRQRLVAVEATDLAGLLEDADELREQWKRDHANTEINPFRRMRAGESLLNERQMIEDFLPGRTKNTQAKLEKRLAGLRKLLESEHQKAMAPVEEWREFNDVTLGVWAKQALHTISQAQAKFAARDFESALALLSRRHDALVAARDAMAGQTTDPRVVERIEGSKIVLDQLDSYRDRVEMGADVSSILESQLRVTRRLNQVREYLVHAELDPDGARSSRLERVSGRVVAVGATDFVVDADGERVTLRFDMLIIGTVRKVVRASDDADDALKLIVWLIALGEYEDASDELERLKQNKSTPEDVLFRAGKITRAKQLAPLALLRLGYFAERAGEAGSDAKGGIERQLRDLQARVAQNDIAGANAYIGKVHEVVDPEMVHLATLEKAMQIGQTGASDLRAWVMLEPLNPDAHAALAEALYDAGEITEARNVAGQALLLDPSNEAAWRIRNAE